MNDNINAEVETDLDTDVEDITVEEDADDTDPDLDTDFEYDENGDIIIPDESGDEDTPDVDAEDEDDADNEQDETDEEATEEPSDAPDEEVVEPAPTTAQPDAKDAEIRALRQRLTALESQSKDTLAKLGVTEGDVMAGLVKLAAEADDMTPEEYLKQKAERDSAAEAQRIVQTMRFEEKIKADLAAVHAAYPETRIYDSVTKLPNFEKFGRFRDAGLTPKEAYIAANPDAVRQNVAAATKKQSLNETKSHLKPVVPKKSKDTSVTMTQKELLEYRDLFPELSDKEIASLYRQTMKK